MTQFVVIPQHNHRIHEDVEYKPCLFPNGKGGWHIQYVRADKCPK